MAFKVQNMRFSLSKACIYCIKRIYLFKLHMHI